MNIFPFDTVNMIVAEMEEKNLFPPPVEPEDLFDQVVDGINSIPRLF